MADNVSAVSTQRYIATPLSQPTQPAPASTAPARTALSVTPDGYRWCASKGVSAADCAKFIQDTLLSGLQAPGRFAGVPGLGRRA